MKSGTDAEKIVIYLTPLVLKLNLKIIIYEFDSPDSFFIMKEFPCYVKECSEIALLYRKTHYDIAYIDKYFEKYTKHLSSFINFEENLKILNYELLEKIRKSVNDELNLNEVVSCLMQNNYAENISNHDGEF